MTPGSTPDVIVNTECTEILSNYKDACESAKRTMDTVSVSLRDLFFEMLDKAVMVGESPTIDNLKLLIEGRDHLYNCYRGRSVYIHRCVPSGRRNSGQRRRDRAHEHAKNVFKKIWTRYNDDVRIMMSLVPETELVDQSIRNVKSDTSTQRLNDVKQFLLGITEDERVTLVGVDRMRWSLYSKYTPTVEEYHRLLSVCKFDQVVVLGVVKVIHFFSYHDMELDHSRVFELIDRLSRSDLLWSFLTLRRTDSFLRELVIQVGNQSYVSIPDMVKNLEDILDDPPLVTTLLSHGTPVRLDGITLTLSNLSLVIRKDETSFRLHKFRLSSIVKRGRDIDPEWVKLSKMEKMPQVADIVDSLGAGFVKVRGRSIFELFEEPPRHGVNSSTRLVRGDYEITEGGDVTIKAGGVSLDGIKYICLPLDTLHMKRFSGSSRVLGMNNVSRVSRNGSVVRLDIPVRYFPDFTLTEIGDVSFNQ